MVNDIVSKGMKWSKETFNKAAAGHYYYKISEKGGQLVLTGAEVRWNKGSDDIYIPSLRVAGKVEDIVEVFSRLNPPLDQETLNGYIAEAYTKDSYKVPEAEGGNAEKFQGEIEEYKAFKSSKVSKKNDNKQPVFTLERLDQLLQAGIPNSTKTRSKKTRSSPSKRVGKRQSLAERLATLPEGKFLDVSHMKEDESNVKSIDKPGATSRKISVPGVSIVSSSEETFRQAMTSLGPDYEQFIEPFVAQMARTETVVPPPVSQKAAPSVTAPKAAAPKAAAPKAVAPKAAAPKPSAPAVSAPKPPVQAVSAPKAAPTSVVAPVAAPRSAVAAPLKAAPPTSKTSTPPAAAAVQVKRPPTVPGKRLPPLGSPTLTK